MTSDEKQTLNKYLCKEISKEELLELYAFNLHSNKNYFVEVLQQALKSDSPEEVDYAITLMTLDSDFNNSEKYVSILCELLREKWHYRHQDIVALLQGIKSQKSADCIYKVALQKFEYLSYDSTYSLPRACIHALAAIGSNEAIDKLVDLSKCDIVEVRTCAQKKLDEF